MTTVTTAQVRRRNRDRVLEEIYRHDGVSKRDLARTLDMSLPTITQNLGDLESEGFVIRRGFSHSTGGRKPQIYSFNERVRLAVGVHMTARGVVVCAVDLRGNCVKRASGRLPYAHRDAYYHRVCQFVNQFIDSLVKALPPSDVSPILGVAFCMQGIISKDGRRVVFGKVLGNEGLTVETFGREISRPCVLVHDSAASAMEEIWRRPDIGDALCLYLEDYLGGAVIIDGRLHQGAGMRNGTVEHMTLVPDGRRCYCGKLGCLDAYCSARSLVEGRDETLKEFFNQVRDDEYTHRRIFHQYLDHLALAVKNMRTVLNCDVVIGGHVGQYLTMDDLADLKLRMQALESFDDMDFRVRKSVCQHDQAAIGAALTFVRDYVDEICGHENR
ncbi:ROK family transcriptional regulator [Bifidobacterium simiarum]|nr:ROK family transcriptional regulator [Bifidobacterium simiarum]MBT1167283.1 ROK family transcriptional regulator [Bifidobacterium simiarum]